MTGTFSGRFFATYDPAEPYLDFRAYLVTWYIIMTRFLIIVLIRHHFAVHINWMACAYALVPVHVQDKDIAILFICKFNLKMCWLYKTAFLLYTVFCGDSQ